MAFFLEKYWLHILGKGSKAKGKKLFLDQVSMKPYSVSTSCLLACLFFVLTFKSECNLEYFLGSTWLQYLPASCARSFTPALLGHYPKNP